MHKQHDAFGERRAAQCDVSLDSFTDKELHHLTVVAGAIDVCGTR
jgi:hypothetical protein